MFAKETLYTANVTDVEKRIIIKALSTLKQKQIEDNKSYDCIDDLIIRFCDAPVMKGKNKRGYEER